jgi:hypothetical protein
MKYNIPFIAGAPEHGDWGVPYEGIGRNYGVVFATLFSVEAAKEFLKGMPVPARTEGARKVAKELGLCK